MADEIIVLTGIKETVDALKEFDKAAARKFNKVINDELTRAEKSADNLVVQFTNPATSNIAPAALLLTNAPALVV